MIPTNEINLKTQIKINNSDIDLEICSIDNGLIKAIKLNNDLFVLNNGFKQSNKDNKSNNISNQQEEPLKTFVHNPDVGTPISNRGKKPLIEEWIRKTKKLEFTLEEYFMIYPKQKQNIAMVYTHISRLINKKSLIQIGENKFKIMV